MSERIIQKNIYNLFRVNFNFSLFCFINTYNFFFIISFSSYSSYLFIFILYFIKMHLFSPRPIPERLVIMVNPPLLRFPHVSLIYHPFNSIPIGIQQPLHIHNDALAWTSRNWTNHHYHHYHHHHHHHTAIDIATFISYTYVNMIC